MKRLQLTLLFLAFGMFTGCEQSHDLGPDILNRNSVIHDGLNASNLSKNSLEKDLPDIYAGLKILRQATAKYHQVEKAIEDGFVRVAGCRENPDKTGGLGVAYENRDRIDANLNLEEPEVLFYESGENGELRLVGVEIVVPMIYWPGNTPPSFYGKEFHKNKESGHYGLHFWIWKPNPDGVLAFWHAQVSCGSGK